MRINVQLDNGQKTVQLHDGDAVCVARIPTPIQGYEASSGYDTTAWFYSTTSQIGDFGSSLAAIQIDSISDGLKVGDKAKITASVTGTYAANLGQAFDKAGLSVYVGSPKSEEVLSQDLTQTTAVTDETGTAEYIFTEPGWYTVVGPLRHLSEDVRKLRLIRLRVKDSHGVPAGFCENVLRRPRFIGDRRRLCEVLAQRLLALWTAHKDA